MKTVALLQLVLHHPPVRALARTLLHTLWEGAAIALLLAAVMQLCRSGSARLRYALACVALAAMPIAFCITFYLSLPVEPVHGRIGGSYPAVGLSLPTVDGLPEAASGLAQSAMLWLVPVWIVGVICSYAYSLAGWMAVQRLRRVGVCAAPAVWQERLCVLATRVGVSKPVLLMESCWANTPVVLGVLRPVILAPLGILAGLPTEQVEAILIHELAHISRHDYLVNLVQKLVEGWFFYHPAVWWISNLVRSEREYCCDDLVVELSGDARSYAEALGTLEQRRWTTTQAALAANGGNLMTRIRRLLHRQEEPHMAAAPLAGLLLLLTCAVLAAWQTDSKQSSPPPMKTPTASVLIAQAPAPQPQPPRVQAAASSPYQKWVTEDVVYIITAEERDAFGRLVNDDERQRFVEQFWLRRDPTPGTDENEFKEEHYRRIAWADDRYFTSDPGWTTDRGRIYITYGPPDDVDDHSGAAGTSPYQIWHYRHLDGIGDDVVLEFVDSAHTGDYRQTFDPRGPGPQR